MLLFSLNTITFRYHLSMKIDREKMSQEFLEFLVQKRTKEREALLRRIAESDTLHAKSVKLYKFGMIGATLAIPFSLIGCLFGVPLLAKVGLYLSILSLPPLFTALYYPGYAGRVLTKR